MRPVGFFVGASLLALAAGVGFALAPAIGVVALGGGTLLAIAVGRASALPPVLLLLAFPLARPSLFGEAYAPVAACLCVAAAILAIITTRREEWDASRAIALHRIVLWLAAASVWVVGRTAFVSTQDQTLIELRGSVILLSTVAGAVIVLRVERYRTAVVRGVIALVALACAMYVITLGIWIVGGVGSGQIGALPVGGLGPQPLYAPFTPTASRLGIFGMNLPRFTGIGREPGWMAMYASFALFLAPRIGWRSPWLRAVLLVGCLGCISTGGFAVLVIVLAYEVFIRSHRRKAAFSLYVRRVFGLAVLTSAAWVAVFAPGLGIGAKEQINAASLAERNAATSAGWQAILTSPLGGGAADSIGGVNLIAAVASYGTPFVVCVALSLLGPRMGNPARTLTTAPVAILLLTIGTSQPPAGSAWVYVCAAVAYAAVGESTDKGPKMPKGATGPRSRTASLHLGDQGRAVQDGGAAANCGMPSGTGSIRSQPSF